MTREQLDSMENSVSNTDKDPAASLLRTAWEPAPQGPPDSPAGGGESRQEEPEAVCFKRHTHRKRLKMEAQFCTSLKGWVSVELNNLITPENVCCSDLATRRIGHIASGTVKWLPCQHIARVKEWRQRAAPGSQRALSKHGISGNRLRPALVQALWATPLLALLQLNRG